MPAVNAASGLEKLAMSHSVSRGSSAWAASWMLQAGLTRENTWRPMDVVPGMKIMFAFGGKKQRIKTLVLAKA